MNATNRKSYQLKPKTKSRWKRGSIQIRGNTFPVKEELKRLGCSWDGEAKCWTTDSEDVAITAGKMSLTVIRPREFNGSPEDEDDFHNEEAEAMAATASTESIFSKPIVNVAPDFSAPISKVKWSDEQLAIFEWFKSGAGHLIVQARAGTGKTTTIKEAFSYAPEATMLYVVFNKKNQKEAADKITDSRVDVLTLNSLGYRFVREYWPDVKPDPSVELDRIVCQMQDMPAEVIKQIERLVSFAKNTFVCIPEIAELVELAQFRDIETAAFEEEEAGGWTQAKLAKFARRAMELALEKDEQLRISYNDQIWLPVVKGWIRAWYDLIVVDECQDMNMPQLAMVRKAIKPTGRVCCVGDDRQAIYGFRGAASDGMGYMREQLNAKTLGLTITYRCPKKVVAMAAAIVPDYRAADSAPDGTVEYLDYDQAIGSLVIGDAVVSRLNAPLMPICLALLRRGIAARIEGRDIGKQLVAIVRKMKAQSVPDFMRKLSAWQAKQIKRAEAAGQFAGAKEEQIKDQVQTLMAVAEGCANVKEIERRLESIFQDTEGSSRPAVVCSSVHKAKGLEWNRTFLLSWTFNRKPMSKGRPPTAAERQEEQNIYYVALTRSKEYMALVDEKPKARLGRDNDGDLKGAI